MNEWYCSECKAHQRAFKCTELYTLPPVLVLLLKRFVNRAGAGSMAMMGGGSYFAPRQMLEKVDELVEYPLELDVTTWCAEGSSMRASEDGVVPPVNNYE